MAKWLYDLTRKLFVDEDGNAMSQFDLAGVRDQYLDSMDTLVADYAANLESGRWTVATFEDTMRNRLKDAHIAEYVLGRGGASQMTQSDWGTLGQTLRQQYRFLRSYLDDLATGQETAGTARNRARNFIGSARSSFSRGRGKSFGFDLPAHPGDGGTPCHGNCRCHWEIEEDEVEIRAIWHVGGAKPCSGCLTRSAEWSPFVWIKPVIEGGDVRP